MMTSRRGPAVTVWCGNYRFGRDDRFFPEVVAAAREYADRESERRPPHADFRDEMERLRGIAPTEGEVLLDQLEHRWTHPDCPPALYVLTCTLRAPEQGAVVSGDGTHVQKLLCSKVGRAKRTVAPRIERYTWDVLGRLRIAEGSQTLRIVIYGDGSSMLLEKEIEAVARKNASRAETIEPSGVRRPVGTETYAGVAIVDAICAFAREHTSA